MPAKILVICGASRNSSLHRVVEVASDALRDTSAELRAFDLAEKPLPVMIPGDAEQGQLSNVRKLREDAQWADGFLIGTPEYHGSLSGVLKNCFDFLYGELAGKLAGVVAATGGGNGDMSIMAVKTCFQWCHGFALPFHAAAKKADFEDGKLVNDKVIDRLQRLAHDLARYAPTLRESFDAARELDGVKAGFAGMH